MSWRLRVSKSLIIDTSRSSRRQTLELLITGSRVRVPPGSPLHLYKNKKLTIKPDSTYSICTLRLVRLGECHGSCRPPFLLVPLSVTAAALVSLVVGGAGEKSTPVGDGADSLAARGSFSATRSSAEVRRRCRRREW